MKKIVLIVIFLLIILSLVSRCNEQNNAPPKDLSVNELQIEATPKESIKVLMDLPGSTIKWRGKKLGGLGGHEGTVEFEEGHLFLKDNRITGGYFTVNMKSLEVTDIPEEQAKAKNNLKHHLKQEF